MKFTGILKREHVESRPWHDARAIARTHASTRANQEKEGLRGR